MRRFRARRDVRELQSEFTGRLKDLYNADKLSEFDELGAAISKTLNIYVPNAELKLRVTEPSLPEIPNPATIAELIEDEYAGAIDRKGHGLQRALIFSLLQHLAVAEPIEPDERSEDDDEGEEELQRKDFDSTEDDALSSSTQAASPDVIIAIEEPELYQHPLRGKVLIADFSKNVSREHYSALAGEIKFCTRRILPILLIFNALIHWRIMRKHKQVDVEPPCSSVALIFAPECSRKNGRTDRQTQRAVYC